MSQVSSLSSLRTDLRIEEIGPDQGAALAGQIHACDAREIYAVSHPSSIEEALREAVSGSTVAWGAYDGSEVPVAVFGVAPPSLLSGFAAPWLLRRADASLYGRAYVRLSRWYRDAMLSEYPILTNWCGAWNQDSIRWLRWLGATVDEPLPVGLHGEWMHRFTITKG